MLEDRNLVPQTQEALHDPWNQSTQISLILKGEAKPWKKPQYTYLRQDVW